MHILCSNRVVRRPRGMVGGASLVIALIGIILARSATQDVVQDDTSLKVDFPAAKARLREAWNAGDVYRVEVFHIPTNVYIRMNVSSTMIEAQFDFKLTDRYRSGSGLVRGLLAAIERTEAQNSGRVADLRWACVFYRRDGERVFAICLDKTGRKGVVDGACVDFDSDEVLKCLLSKCASLFR